MDSSQSRTTLFQYPKKAHYGRVIAKSKIYDFAKPSKSIRDRFVDEIDQISWQYKLSTETINLPAKGGVSEIQIFSVALRTKEVTESVLQTIDKAISFPIFFELTYQGKTKVAAAYKRPSEADRSQWVVDSYFYSAWCNSDTNRIPLPLALDLASLYEQMLSTLITFAPREGESLRERVARINQIRAIQNELKKLETAITREKQFNRKVELNSQLRQVKNNLDNLMN